MMDLVFNENGRVALVHDVRRLDGVKALHLDKDARFLTATYADGKSQLLFTLSDRVASWLVGCESMQIIRMTGLSIARAFDVPVIQET